MVMIKKLRIPVLFGLFILALALPARADLGADLTISLGAVSDITAQANDEVTIQAIVQNIGVGPTDASSVPNATMALLLVTDPARDDELLAAPLFDVPIAGSNATINFTFTVPDAPGTYHLYALADKDDIVEESNEQNNSSETITLEVVEPPEIIGPMPDLRVTATFVDGEPVAVIGDRMILDVTVENFGDGTTATIKDDDYSGLFDVALYIYFLDPDTGQVVFQRRMEFWFFHIRDFEDPAGLIGMFKSDIEDPNKFFDDPLSGDLVEMFSLTTLGLLGEWDSELPPSVQLRQALESELNNIIANGSNLFDIVDFSQIELPLSVLNIISREPQGENLIQLNRILLEIAYTGMLRSHLYGPLDSGDDLDGGDVGLNFPVPDQPGTYYFVAVVDKGDLVLESHESNNWGNMFMVQVVEPQCDMKVTSTTITDRQDDTINVTALVENIGGFDTSAPTSVSLYLFTDTVLGPLVSGQVVAQRDLAGGIVPGETQLLNLSFDVSDPTSTYYLAVHVETDNDSDQTNDWGEYIILQLPDLTITATEFIETTSDSATQVMVRLENINQADVVDDIDVRLFLLSDPSDDPAGMVPIASTSVVALDSGAGKTFIMTIASQQLTDAGYLVAVADQGNLIAEADETNNQGQAVTLKVPDVGIKASKMIVKADKDRLHPWDSFIVYGTIDASLEELTTSDSITVNLYSQQTTIYSEQISVSQGLNSPTVPVPTSQAPVSFGTNWKSFSGSVGIGGTINGRIVSKGTDNSISFRYTSLEPIGITMMLLKLKKSWQKEIGTFKIIGHKIDLTHLTSPVKLEIVFGDYIGRATIDEDIINGSKPMPALLMSGIADTLRVDRAVVKKEGSSLVIRGAITAQNLDADLENKELTITWGPSQIYILPQGSFVRVGPSGRHKYICRNTRIFDIATVKTAIDLDNAVFNISITDSKSPILSPSQGYEFGISFEGFSATTQIN